MLDKLREALDKLPNEERKLIDALFLSNNGDGMSEREYAKHLGLSKTALHTRKQKVLHKLKKFFGN